MPRYDIVLLDADNTLFDFTGAERAALGRALEGRGLPFTPRAESCYLEINRALWAAFDRGEISQEHLVVERFRRLLSRLGAEGDPAGLNGDYLSRLGEDGRLLPGAEALCRRLAGAGCRLALATNGVGRVQRARLARSPLSPLFSGVFISGELGARKPEPAFFDAALAALGAADRSRCVMVGDSLSADIQGGAAAGLDTIWFCPGEEEPQPGEASPTHTARSLEEAGRIILRD